MMLYQTFWLYPPALAHRGTLSCHPHYESPYSPPCAPGLWSFVALWLLLGLIPSPFSCVLVSLCSLETSLTPSHLQSTSWWGDGGAISLNDFNFCSGADLWGLMCSCETNLKIVKIYFFIICLDLVSAHEWDDFSLQRHITWQNLDGGFSQASNTFLTHKPKSCHISSSFSKAWGHEEKVTKFLETRGEK